MIPTNETNKNKKKSPKKKNKKGNENPQQRMSIFLKKGKIKREKGLQSLLPPREFRTRTRRNPKKAKETVAPKKQAQTNSNKFPSLPTSSQTKSLTTKRALNQGRTLLKPVAIPEARSR